MTGLSWWSAQQLAAACWVAATALICWPSRRASRRLTFLSANRDPGSGQRPIVRLRAAWTAATVLALRPRAVTGIGGIVGVAGFLFAGPGAGIAAGLLTGTVLSRRRRQHADRRQVAATRGVVDALGALIAELRAGAHAAAAAAGAAADAEEPAAAALLAAAATARLGGAVAPTLVRFAATDHALAMPLGRLARAWALADRYGVALADVLADVRRDLEHRARFASQLAATMSGPRATATVLAALPVLGVLLGDVLGAEPLQVLTTTPAGQALLVVGVALLCAGLCWSDWLISRAARR